LRPFELWLTAGPPMLRDSPVLLWSAWQSRAILCCGPYIALIDCRVTASVIRAPLQRTALVVCPRLARERHYRPNMTSLISPHSTRLRRTDRRVGLAAALVLFTRRDARRVASLPQPPGLGTVGWNSALVACHLVRARHRVCRRV
jgi:hypothetical protein